MDEQPRQAEAAHPELEQLKQALAERGLPYLATLGAVLVVVLGLTGYRGCARRRRMEAALLLSQARTVQDLETVVRQHGGTPSAPLALLQLAKMRYDAGDPGGALSHYEAFLSGHAEHPLAPAARLGKLHCLEMRGLLEQARSGFAAFADAQPDHFLAPQALFGEARCLELLGRHKEARALYEDFIAGHPESPWLPRAEELLDAANRRIERGSNAFPNPISGLPSLAEPAIDFPSAPNAAAALPQAAAPSATGMPDAAANAPPAADTP